MSISNLAFAQNKHFAQFQDIFLVHTAENDLKLCLDIDFFSKRS